MILDRIVEKKKEELEQQKISQPLSEIKRYLADQKMPRDFKGALMAKPRAIIAEVKRSSPSKGRLVNDFHPVEIASLYEGNGAAAISVLTEKHFFEGDGTYLSEIKNSVHIPVLRKDFIIDPYQIYETKFLGGDALLLIACLLDQGQLNGYIGLAAELGLAALVEVHDRSDLEKAVYAKADLIGINNRNLKTFTIDLQTTIDLVQEIPDGSIVVSESGIQSRQDIERLESFGVHAFLIGEVLMRSGNIPKKLSELLHD
jgi:indole-3-glycerol phosphate synthase